jgi:AcrR family transcriptional regulator
MKRNYDMTKRSTLAAETTAKIISAAERLLADKPLKEINLKQIAKEADTTVQTVLRHLESREGCLNAVAFSVAERVEKQRGKLDYHNIEAAVSDLIGHYETEGRLVLNLLAQEQSGDLIASKFTDEGRKYHREWVKRCFDKYLVDQRKSTIDALVVATDIYAWKLLRLDLKRSRAASQNIITQIVKKILEVQ